MNKKKLYWILLLDSIALIFGLLFKEQLIITFVVTILCNLIFIYDYSTDAIKEHLVALQQAKAVSEQKEKNFQIKSVQLETIVTNLPFPMSLVDGQGNIILSNLLFQQFAINTSGPLSFDTKNFLPEIKSFIRNTYISEEATQKTLNINTIDYQAISVPVYDKGRYSGCLVMFLDVTQILEGERFQKRFIADASHELKTPLSSITGMIQILNRPDFNDEETRKEFSHQIEEEALRMDSIIQDLLTLSKLSSKQVLLELERIQLSELIKGAYSPLKQKFKEKSITFISEIDESIILTVDRDKFHQVITNLLINALKFTEKGSVTINAIKQELFCILTIKDTGVGIPKEDQKYIFERFYRSDTSRSRQSGGSGLGLAIVKSYLSAHKADIEVSSELGQGSTFTLKIPMGH
ncbi:MAG: sensor histidine kinase [Erysipelotrichaceae bacterium]|nr:sensor histidine kinase [Erysipelotrichaceae bacterium]